MAMPGSGQISTANTNRDGTGTIVDIFTAGSNGAIIQKLEATAIVTTTAGMVRWYIYQGSAYRLFYEMTVDAITVAAAVAGWTESYTPSPPIPLKADWKIGASTHNAETFNCLVTAINL